MPLEPVNTVQPLSVVEAIARQAEVRPDAVALRAVCGTGIRYRRLQQICQRLGQWVAAEGVTEDDIVVLAMPDGPELAAAFLGVAGVARCLVLPPATGRREVASLFDWLQPRLVLTLAETVATTTADVAAAWQIPAVPLSRMTTSPDDCCRPKGVTHLGSESVSKSQRLPSPDRTAWLAMTSGTTGTPKLVPLSHAQLLAATNRVVNAFGLGPSDRSLSIMPLAHAHGLIASLLAPLVSGGEVICAPGFVATEFFHWLERFAPTWYTAVPTVHQAILARTPRHAPQLTTAGLRFIRSSSARLARSVERQLAGAFAVPVIETYGLTEAFQITSNPLPPAEAKPGSVGRPPVAGQIAILDQQGRPAPIGSRGEVAIDARCATTEYLTRDRSATGQDTGASASLGAGSRWFCTGDEGYLDTDGFLFITGRFKEAINRGGEQIAPYEIEEVLLDHPSVAEAVVLGVPDTRLGEDVAAAVVLRPGHTATAAELRRAVARELPINKVPQEIAFVTDISKGPTGKPQRIGMAERLELGRERRVHQPHELPQDAAETELVSIWQEVLQCDPIGVEDDFFDLGGDSILAGQVAARMRDALHCDVDLLTIFEARTIRNLARALQVCDTSDSSFRLRAPAAPNRDTAAPLTASQARFWLLDQLAPGSSAYHVCLVLDIAGPLDTDALQAALDYIRLRHEPLHTRYGEQDGHAVQFLDPADAPLDFTQVDLEQEAAGHAAERLLAEHTARHINRPFDLAAHAPLRAVLMRVAAERFRLAVVIHHIACDGWSLSVLLRELEHLYADFCDQRAPALETLPLCYRDVAHWQQGAAWQKRCEAQLDYWRRQLGGALPMLALPLGGTPSPDLANSTSDHGGKSARGVRLPVALDAATVKQIDQFAHRQGATPYMVLLSSYYVTLARYSNQNAICIATPHAGRTDQRFESLIGAFINTLVLRIETAGGANFIQVLARARQVALEAFAHADVPLEQVRAAVAGETHPARELFRTLFVLQNVGGAFPKLRDCAVSRDYIGPHEPLVDFSLQLRETGSTLAGFFEFDATQFDAAAVEQFAQHWKTLLRRMLADPQACCWELPLLSEDEYQRHTVEWNRHPLAEMVRASADGPGLLLHERFAAHARRSPEKIALHYDGASLTYAELDDRAARLAALLLSRGVHAESRVAVALDRSVDLVVSLLAVLRAGGAYVPLDPAYPAQRLAMILEDASASLLITRRDLGLDISQAGLEHLDIDSIDLAQQRPAAAQPVAADTLAYVIFTSGSTGRPKGVAISHRSAAALAHWAQHAYSSDEFKCVLFATSVCFDLSVFELLVTLSAGGSVALVDSPLALLEQTPLPPVTLINTVPSAMQALAAAKAIPPTVKTINLAGEPLTPELVDAIYGGSGVEHVYDLYGPSEDTTYSTSAKRLPGGNATIGRSLPGTRAYVLNPALQPQPAYVPGELYLAGIGLARGYLSRPDLTAERFLPDPLAPAPGERMYRTGDLVRWLPGGNLQYLGRIDHQVKIRGYRIELGEIETVLRGLADVDDAVVVAQEHSSGDCRLVAYIVRSTDGMPAEDRLRDAVATQLPAYMVPASFVVLDAFPRTPNGKLDRGALPAPADPGCAEGTSPPQDELEAIIACTWEDLLGVESVGREDDFFRLGGHSLLATRVVARLRHQLACMLPLRALFDHPQVRQLAAYCREHPRQERERDWDAGRVDRSRPVPLSFAQEQLWFFNRINPHLGCYNVPVAYRIVGTLHAHILEEALGRVVERHEALRTRVVSSDGYPQGAIDPYAGFTLPLLDLSGVAEADRETQLRGQIDTEAKRPFDLEQDLPLRVRLIRLSDEEHVLQVTFHHLAADDWSLGIFNRELATHYEAILSNKPAALARLPLQFADFANAQRQALSGDRLEERLAAWESALAGTPGELNLPTDAARASVPGFEGARMPFSACSDVTDALRKLARESGATLFTVTMAAVDALLWYETGQERFAVGTPMTLRFEEEYQQPIGFFLNTLPLKANLEGDPTFLDILGRVKQAALAAHAYPDIPLEQLISRLGIKSSASRTPLFQVMVVLTQKPEPLLPLPEVQVQRYPVNTGSEKFDWTLFAEESAEGLEGELSFNASLFSKSRMQRVARQWQHLLATVAANPRIHLSQLADLLRQVAQRQSDEQQKSLQQSGRQKLKSLRRRAAVSPPLPPSISHE